MYFNTFYVFDSFERPIGFKIDYKRCATEMYMVVCFRIGLRL